MRPFKVKDPSAHKLLPVFPNKKRVGQQAWQKRDMQARHEAGEGGGDEIKALR